MSTRADLLVAAERLAARARDTQSWQSRLAPPGLTAEFVAAAKTALEAAALAENVSASEIDEALGQIQDLLEQGGVLEQSLEFPPAEFLDRTFRALLAWRGEALAAQAHTVAYERLHDLLIRLERDFIAGDTETSRRIAGRIRTALDDAEELIAEKGGAHGAPAASGE